MTGPAVAVWGKLLSAEGAGCAGPEVGARPAPAQWEVGVSAECERLWGGNRRRRGDGAQTHPFPPSCFPCPPASKGASDAVGWIQLQQHLRACELQHDSAGKGVVVGPGQQRAPRGPRGFAPRGAHPCLLCLHGLQGQSEDPDSLLSLFRRLSDLRGKERALLHGDFYVLSSGPDLFSYLRQWDQNKRFLVVLNFGDVAHAARLGAFGLPASVSLPAGAELLLSTQPGWKEGDPVELQSLSLKPHEGLLLQFPYAA